jgi:AcrR family transcriptional regulator
MAITVSEDIRRQEILDATVAVLVERGFASTRVADVAARAGTSTGTVHYHFPTKADLLDAAFRHASDRARDRHRAVIEAQPDAHQQMLALIELQTPEGPVADEWAIWLEFWNEARLRPEWRERNAELYAAWVGWLTEVVDAGVRSGQFRADLEPADVARRFAALVDGLAIQCLLDPSPQQRWQMRRTLVAMVERELVA